MIIVVSLGRLILSVVFLVCVSQELKRGVGEFLVDEKRKM